MDRRGFLTALASVTATFGVNLPAWAHRDHTKASGGTENEDLAITVTDVQMAPASRDKMLVYLKILNKTKEVLTLSGFGGDIGNKWHMFMKIPFEKEEKEVRVREYKIPPSGEIRLTDDKGRLEITGVDLYNVRDNTFYLGVTIKERGYLRFPVHLPDDFPR